MRIVTLTFCLVWILGCEKKTEEQQWEAAIAALPWMLDVLDYCNQYKSTEAQADKNDLTVLAASHVKGSTANAVRGVIEKLLPPSDERPDQYSVQILVADRVRFASQSKELPIERGSKVFDQLSAMKEGQCVVVSAQDFSPIAPFQQARVCDPRYYARFTDIQSCP